MIIPLANVAKRKGWVLRLLDSALVPAIMEGHAAYSRTALWFYRQLHLRAEPRKLFEKQCAHAGILYVNRYEMTNVFIFLFGIWEPPITYILEEKLKKGDIFIDIGTNIGYYLLLAHKKGAKIIAFEPCPSILLQLTLNMEANGINKDLLRRCAVTATRTKVPFFIGPADDRGKSSLMLSGKSPHKCEVEGVPVRDFKEWLVEAKIVKVDVEGTEDVILSQIFDFAEIMRNDSFILCEIDRFGTLNGKFRAKDIIGKFIEAGWHLFFVENKYTPQFYRSSTFTIKKATIDDFLNVTSGKVDIILSKNLIDFNNESLILDS